LHFDGGGWGARHDHDGNSAQIVKTSNCANTPIEVLETRYPLQCIEYSLNTALAGRPGAGRFRGGFGTRRILRVTAPRMTLSAHTNRNRVRPWGRDGGSDGGNCTVWLRRRGEEGWKTAPELFGTVSAGKFSNVELREGDEVALGMPGGAGYGDPTTRDPALVEEDVRNGLYTLDEAREIYAVVLDSATGGVVEEETDDLRRARDERAAPNLRGEG
jgi:N-methylhydantoinase B/oxoprolinase/acetone carboxylase alpha subunit